ncbi:DUF2397 family protein [Streptomyces sp. NPDC057433]|uniref:DUF2397 family protein n=1 Tax=Streptomyces sp. NPDC057433 TaxID=3346132 RepID=UPI00367C0EE4
MPSRVRSSAPSTCTTSRSRRSPRSKERLIQYLERFAQDLVTLGGRIALPIGELEERGRVEPLLRLAAARESADAAPGDAGHAERTAYEKWAPRPPASAGSPPYTSPTTFAWCP